MTIPFRNASETAQAIARLRSPSNSTLSSTVSSASIPEPPSYDPPEVPEAGPASTTPGPPPLYHFRPTADEDTVLSGAPPVPEGLFTRRSKLVVVALTNQETTAESVDGDEQRPTYGKGANVTGVVELQGDGGVKLSDILRLKVKIQGKLKLEITDGGTFTQKFLEHEIPLYSKANSVDICPTMLPFSHQLPLVFMEDSPDGSVERQLPPTYLYHYEGVPGIRAQVAYSVKVVIERKVFLKLSRNHVLRIPFNYTPRTRPHVPGPPPGSSFTALVKQMPDDWAAFLNDVPRRQDPTNRQVQHVQDSILVNGETVTSALVIPSTQTFPLTQNIPFHLQLSVTSSEPSLHSASESTNPRGIALSRRPKTAPPRSPSVPPPHSNLLSLFTAPTFGSPSLIGRRARANTQPVIVGLGEGMAADGAMFGDPRYANAGRGNLDLKGQGASSTPVRSDVSEEHQKSYVRVFLQRQIVLVVNGQKVVKTLACGDAAVHRVLLDEPPRFGSMPAPSRDGVDFIAWEGQVAPNRSILTVGGFRTTALWVKDFITLTMVPPDPEHSPLRTLHHAVPVKLTSDAWEEEWWHQRRV